MSHARRTRTTGLAVAIALTAVLIGTQIAAAEDPVPVPDAGPRFDAGMLALHINGSTTSDYWVYTKEDSTLGGQQNIRTNKCVPNYSGSTLVTLASQASASSSVGFLDGYGVKTSSEGNAGKCAQVNTPDQLLKLSLANASGQALDGLYVDTAQVDIEAKFNAFINIAIFKDGLQVDADASTSPTDDPNTSIDESKVLVDDCTSSGSDCGPDSADGDNFRLTVPALGTTLFDEMWLWPSSGGSGGGVALEGGADAGTSDSTFHLALPADGSITCGGTVSEGTAGAQVSVEYLAGSCTTGDSKAYILTRSSDEVEFLTQGAGNAQFEVQVNAWDPEPAVYPIPPTQTDPTGDDNNADGEWCNGTAADPLMPVDDPLTTNVDEDESWCLITQSAATYGPDGTGGQLMQVTEAWLLIGDAKLNR